MLVASRLNFSCTSSPSEPRFGHVIVETHDKGLREPLNDLFAKNGLKAEIDTKTEPGHLHGEKNTYFLKVITPDQATDKAVANAIHNHADFKDKISGVYEQSPPHPVVAFIQPIIQQIIVSIQHNLHLGPIIPNTEAASHNQASPVEDDKKAKATT